MLPAARGVILRSSGGVGGPEGVTDCMIKGLKTICASQTILEYKKEQEVLVQVL